MRISVFTFASVITTMMHIATVNAFTCSYYCGNDTNPAEFHPGLTDSCCGSQGNYDINGNCKLGNGGPRNSFASCCQGSELDICFPKGADGPYACGADNYPVECN
ncbi:hypothetical protein PSV09DRAFT_2260072 [Bipolaris maydis]|nr:hypothetical protein J3E74DRAFT_286446 [Bipolaris maydis]KAJ6207991.1 hypothetical protein PSV09DRAFT_2260072 [Bipolaris maydis]